MWIFFNDAFLSIVEAKDGFKQGDKRNRLLVRARAEEDIKAVFPDAHVTHTPVADYHYRAFISRPEVARVIDRRVREINYGNFKSSVKDHGRHMMLLRIWSLVADHFMPPVLSRYLKKRRPARSTPDLDDELNPPFSWTPGTKPKRLN